MIDLNSAVESKVKQTDQELAKLSGSSVFNCDTVPNLRRHFAAIFDLGPATQGLFKWGDRSRYSSLKKPSEFEFTTRRRKLRWRCQDQPSTFISRALRGQKRVKCFQ
ncbi:uncharacterized protein [Montipora capricornis]|uniref:uncharacterized protein n=1 Tax=Montipora capricornis TaxID=246305 RepID=UPI0035F1D4CB